MKGKLYQYPQSDVAGKPKLAQQGYVQKYPQIQVIQSVLTQYSSTVLPEIFLYVPPFLYNSLTRCALLASENLGFQPGWVMMLHTQNTYITLSLRNSIWSLFTPSKFFYIFIAQYVIIPWFCRLVEMIKGDNSRTLKQNPSQIYPWISQPDGFFQSSILRF